MNVSKISGTCYIHTSIYIHILKLINNSTKLSRVIFETKCHIKFCVQYKFTHELSTNMFIIQTSLQIIQLLSEKYSSTTFSQSVIRWWCMCCSESKTSKTLFFLGGLMKSWENKVIKDMTRKTWLCVRATFKAIHDVIRAWCLLI